LGDSSNLVFVDFLSTPFAIMPEWYYFRYFAIILFKISWYFIDLYFIIIFSLLSLEYSL
jgi:hypothetical protein